jgi:hypothetical protein
MAEEIATGQSQRQRRQRAAGLGLFSILDFIEA